MYLYDNIQLHKALIVKLVGYFYLLMPLETHIFYYGTGQTGLVQNCMKLVGCNEIENGAKLPWTHEH